MPSLALLLAGAGSAAALLAGARPSVGLARAASPAMTAVEEGPTFWEAYAKARDAGKLQGGTLEDAKEEFRQFIKGGGDMEFDGGDSGGGVVGDGNTDLEDQHNSASIVRGGFGAASVSDGGSNVGRGRVDSMVQSAVEARTASAGKNYFGRTTGFADQKISEITEDDRKTQRLDEVRAQQLENWFNQRAIHKSNRAQGQGVVFGAETTGHYIAREVLSSAAHRSGAQESEVSVADLAKHMQKLSTLPAQRLDGAEWGELVLDGTEAVTKLFELRCAIGKTSITEIAVKNQLNTFAPYRVAFTADSDQDFHVTPAFGSMNRRSGEPVNLVVTFLPGGAKDGATATLIFETEDFKNIYKFLVST